MLVRKIGFKSRFHQALYLGKGKDRVTKGTWWLFLNNGSYLLDSMWPGTNKAGSCLLGACYKLLLLHGFMLFRIHKKFSWWLLSTLFTTGSFEPYLQYVLEPECSNAQNEHSMFLGLTMGIEKHTETTYDIEHEHPFQEHILRYFCRNGATCYNYFMNYFSRKVHHPGQKNG